MKTLEDAVNESRKQAVYAIEHDVRALVRAARQYLSILEEDNLLREEGLEFYHKIAERLGSLDTALCTMSRFIEEPLKPKTQKFLTPSELLQSLEKQVWPDSRTWKLKVQQLGANEAKIPAAVLAPLTHLCENIYEHADSDKIELMVKMDGPSELFIVLRDFGKGSLEGDSSKLLQLMRTAEGFDAGKGLGLALANKMISESGGWLILRPQGTKGFEAEMRWPL